jgi:SAM-dependent methyltransferase
VSQHDRDGLRLRYDLTLSHLVLHHIGDLEGVLRTILECLKKGGSVALTDFEDFGPEANKFHSKAKMDGVERHGIKRDWMTGLMEKVG